MRTVAAAIVALLCLPAAADEVDDFCRDRWGVDYVMREYCIKEQRAARARIGATASDQLDPAGQMQYARFEAIRSWLRERDILLFTPEIEALAATNPDAAHYVQCELDARKPADEPRLKLLLDCLIQR